MAYKNFFWLHIKKSAGISTRSMMEPYYIEVDRSEKPSCFLQSDPVEHNDILNNYRVVLGEYQFRRSLFAKRYLYPNSWDEICSFAFCRDPTERCLSMFYYLFWKPGISLGRTRTIVSSAFRQRTLLLSTSYAFDLFLDRVLLARASHSNFSPLGLHFSTHTASMWEDITDLEGNILLKHVFRLENLNEGLNRVFEECGIEKRIAASDVRLNKNKAKVIHKPNNKQMAKIENLYSNDYEIFESISL